MAAENPQPRKWLVTINNPEEHGFTRDVILDKLKSLNLIYYCISDEIGLEEQTPHVHIFLIRSSGIRFTTMQNLFDKKAHLDICKGTNEDNRDYVLKEGKWKDKEKGTTSVPGTQFEFGELPIERQGHRSDLDELYDMVQSGMSVEDIISECPSFAPRRRVIDELIIDKHKKQFGNVFRNLKVTYMYGATGTGKTSSIAKNYGYENIYRVNNYKNPFDYYAGQDIIVFEEFHGQISITDMLCYLDGHPCYLPCRFHDKIACYTQVFFTSNVKLEDLYKTIQNDFPETYNAFLRRLHRVFVYNSSTDIKMYAMEEYRNLHKPQALTREEDFYPVPQQMHIPFTYT